VNEEVPPLVEEPHLENIKGVEVVAPVRGARYWRLVGLNSMGSINSSSTRTYPHFLVACLLFFNSLGELATAISAILLRWWRRGAIPVMLTLADLAAAFGASP